MRGFRAAWPARLNVDLNASRRLSGRIAEAARGPAGVTALVTFARLPRTCGRIATGRVPIRGRSWR